MTTETAWGLWILYGVICYSYILFKAATGHKWAIIIVCIIISSEYGDYQYTHNRDSFAYGFVEGLTK